MELQLVSFEQAKALKELGFPQNLPEYYELREINGKGENCKCLNRGGMEGFSSRKEVTLAAIDVALDYLRDKK